jgi:hypothetical protein
LTLRKDIIEQLCRAKTGITFLLTIAFLKQVVPRERIGSKTTKAIIRRKKYFAFFCSNFKSFVQKETSTKK